MRKKQSDKIRQLEKEIIDLKIRQHKNSYIHIPFSWPGLGRFFLWFISVALFVGNSFLLYNVGRIFKVLELLGTDNEGLKTAYHSSSQLIIIYPLIGEYILIGLYFICLTAFIKGGFDKLKKWDDAGLIDGLIYGLIVGLIVGLIGGLIVGLIVGLIYGLIGILIVCLIYGLIVGLIDGLISEFE